MKWGEFLDEFGDHPLFHSSMLDLFPDSRPYVRVQLSRWVGSGKLVQIRRGWYLIASPFRKKEVPAAVIANSVVSPSYLSLEWAMAFHGMIPEAVPNPTSVTTVRADGFRFEGRSYLYRNIQPACFLGYERIEYQENRILVAVPEKALWDTVYLFVRRGGFSSAWLDALRLQNLDRFDFQRWRSYGELSRMSSIKKALPLVEKYIVGRIS